MPREFLSRGAECFLVLSLWFLFLLFVFTVSFVSCNKKHTILANGNKIKILLPENLPEEKKWTK